MNLTDEQNEIRNGSKGEIQRKIMETLIRYGELFGADSMIAITSEHNHLVTSIGIKPLKVVFDLLQTIIDANEVSKQKFTVDPRPLDPHVPATERQKFVFENHMYTFQKEYEEQLKNLGLVNENAFTCTCYMKEVGNIPKKGDILSWSESSAVVFANSVLGARCNRNSGIIDLMGSILGYVPKFGLLTDDGRKASWIIEIRTTKKPEAQLLGSAVGMKVIEDVPYIIGLDKWLGNELDDKTKSYLKDFGAAAASNGAVGLYHVEGLTPEAVESGRTLILPDAKKYIIDDAVLQQVQENYPVMWKDKNALPQLCFIGCPHLSFDQLVDWTQKICAALLKNGRKTVCIPTVFTAAPAVIQHFEMTPEADMLKKSGVILSYICPLMYMNNPLSSEIPVITQSNKLRTYSTARYYTNDEILNQITGGE